MQENDFEKRVRKQMEEFTLVPNDRVWQQVQDKIGKEKRRRLLFYWTFAALVVTGGLATFIFLNKSNTSEIKKRSSEKSSSYDLSSRKREIKKALETSIAKNDPLKEHTSTRRELLPPSVVTKANTTFHHKKSKSSNATGEQNARGGGVMTGVSTLDQQQQEILDQGKSAGSNSVKRSPLTQRMEGKANLTPHKYLLSETNRKLQTDTLQRSTASAELATEIRDTSALSKKENGIQQIKGKNIRKWRFGFAVYGGVSDNITGIGLGSEKSLFTADANGAFSSPTSIASRVPPVSRLQYKSGASFGAGASVQKGLTRRLKITAGLDYHYMSARSQVGNKVDSGLNVLDSALQQTTTITPFFRGGQSTLYTNKYHLIQLPVTLQLQLNKNISRPLLLSLGLSPSFLVASNALYLNNKAAVYYREKKQFNQFMLFGQSELLFTVSNKPKYELNVGPTVQYGFNSFSKTETNTSQHLIFTGIKTNIIFK